LENFQRALIKNGVAFPKQGSITSVKLSFQGLESNYQNDVLRGQIKSNWKAWCGIEFFFQRLQKRHLDCVTSIYIFKGVMII